MCGRFVNMPMFPKRKETDYAQFLGRVAKFDDVPMKSKINLANYKVYKEYVKDLVSYLRDFFQVPPLPLSEVGIFKHSFFATAHEPAGEC